MPVFQIYQRGEDRETMEKVAAILEAKGYDITDKRRGVRSLSEVIRIIFRERLEQEQQTNDR